MAKAARANPYNRTVRGRFVMRTVQVLGVLILSGIVFSLVAPETIGTEVIKRFYSPSGQQVFADLAHNPDLRGKPGAIAIF